MRHLIRTENGNHDVSMCGVLVHEVEPDPADAVCGHCVVLLVGSARQRLAFGDS